MTITSITTSTRYFDGLIDPYSEIAIAAEYVPYVPGSISNELMVEYSSYQQTMVNIMMNYLI